MQLKRRRSAAEAAVGSAGRIPEARRGRAAASRGASMARTPRQGPSFTSTSSTSKVSSEFGGIVGGRPCSP